MSKLLDVHEFCKDLNEIKTSKLVNNRGKFIDDGLFSEQIFGPIKNYTCQCNIFHGKSKTGKICKKCNVEIIGSGERRKRFAKIVLPMNVVNPIFYDLVTTVGGSKIKNMIDSLMKNEKSILYKKENIFVVTTKEEDIPEKTEVFEKIEAIFHLIFETSKMKTDEKWVFIRENINKLIIKDVIVLPCDLRPASKNANKKNKHSHVVDQINDNYRRLLLKKESMYKTIYDVNSSKKIYYQYYKPIQKMVNELYNYILNKMSKKDGLIRGNILGKRIDFSGRGVIVPDPTLKLDECKLPYFMFMELFKIQISKRLTYVNRFKFLNDAIKYVDDCIKSKKYHLYRFCERMLEEETQVCILNRQPSLHRLSMLGFKIKLEVFDGENVKNPEFDPKIHKDIPENRYLFRPNPSNVIKIHPLVCPCFNADFDGDQMAVYVPISNEAKEEILNKFLSTKNLFNPANGELTTTPSQDIILGIYALTNNKFPKLNKNTNYKGKRITKSIRIFNECLPDDYPLINFSVSEKELLNILNDINKKYSEDIIVAVLDNIKKIGFKYATLFGPTMSLDVCQLENATLKNELYSSDAVVDQLNKISSKETEEYLRKNFGYSYMIDSGSRGSWDQARQIILSRGFVSNFKGQIVDTPIKSSLLDGLTPKEFFISTYGSRKGLLDVALNTGVSGYLSRKLIFSCTNLKKHKDLDDCGTKDYLNVEVKNEKKASMLIYRNYLNDSNECINITKDNYKNIIGKTIKLRSPVHCKSYNICHKCYGDLYKLLNTNFIGIIAAQTLGERSTQLILRTFHTSGVANIKGEKEHGDMKQDDIVADLSVASKLFHHFDDKKCDQIINDLFEVYNTNGRIHHIHIEAVVTQLMWSNFVKWRLIENKNEVDPEFYSIQKVPSYESWILGLGFSNPKQHIIRGLLKSGNYFGIMDRILMGKNLS